MRRVLILPLIVFALSNCWAQSRQSAPRPEAEFYIGAYARHYGVPVALVRAIVERESSWHPCTVSPKGAVGLMQLMPVTAKRLGTGDRCNIDQNVSGGVHYLAWLMQQFHNDLRLVAAAFYAGDDVIRRQGLAYRNPEVVAYVASIRTTYLREAGIKPRTTNTKSERDVR